MRTRAATGSGCARAASWCASRASRSPHLIGIAVDITEQKRLAEESATAEMRLSDAIEAISEAFVVWDADNRLVLCNSKFQSLHGLTDEAVASGTPYEDISAAGSKPIVRMQLSSEGRAVPGARTFEAQLEDGRWLQISERRTKDGGFVSVGTNITQLKLHEEKLIESEKRLKATWSICARRSRRWSARPNSSHTSPSAMPSRRTAPKRRTRRSHRSSPT
jgi:two-component system cell cycle sensor histidine kinase PleC